MSATPSTTIRIGTRASALARWQADWVAGELQRLGHSVELVYITTSGDEQQLGPVGQIGTVGVFTKEIQNALLDGRVDLAVHSLKDLPTDPVPGLTLSAVPERETVDDVLIGRDGKHFAQLPAHAKIGTGSARRKSQLRYARADLEYLPIRGNVDTRLRKLHDGEYDAIILAAAGLTRLGWAMNITERLSKDVMLPAVGQGALGLETRTDDAKTRAAIASLDHPTSHVAVLAERTLLAELRGGCSAPIGAWGRFEQPGLLTLSAVVLSPDGTERILAEERVPLEIQDDWTVAVETAEELGKQVAMLLIQSGAERMIWAARAEG